ncbi:MAG: protein translocase subunit SecD [Chloroflexi bacterium]|nr:protein translocase subunit SecD [Chloroflexota bacterium]
MTRSRNTWLIVIALLIIFSLWVDLSNNITIMNPFNDKPLINRDTQLQLGLDIRGGLQTLLQADVANCSSVDPSALDVTRQILQNRVNALGISEITMQTAGNCRIIAEFPGITNPQQVNDSLQQTALLEFVDMGNNPLPVGSTVVTDYQSSSASAQPSTTAAAQTATAAPTETATPASTATPEANATPGATPTATAPAQVYHTVMTGADLDTVSVQAGTLGGQYEIAFTLKPNGTKVFGDYTSTHVGQYLAIVLDKKVISAPVINSAITGGQGVIQGNFTADTANALAVQLRYGSLPVPVKIVESQTVGPTLGADSVRKSILAGAIGLAVVILFMALYYRLPGIIADLALVTYAILSLMIFKMVGFTLSLPGTAGFILSIGMAVDANVLIFERLKEELRAGRNLQQAIDLGWSRAWPSIRDSNISTLITCTILFIFGNAYGASIVKGFSINLGLGVLVSLFTAVVVTRIYLHLVLDNIKMSEHPRWLGL